MSDAKPFSDEEMKWLHIFYSTYSQRSLLRRFLATIDADRKKIAELEGKTVQQIIEGYKADHQQQIAELKAEVERLKAALEKKEK